MFETAQQLLYCLGALPEHEVDRISDRRITLLAGGRYEYLVHWVGGDRTWEPDFNLEGCEESIKQYEEELRVALPNERDMSTDMEEYTTVYTDEHYHYQPPSENNEILHKLAGHVFRCDRADETSQPRVCACESATRAPPAAPNGSDRPIESRPPSPRALYHPRPPSMPVHYSLDPPL